MGHYPHCEAPERFVEVLVDFIASTKPARMHVRGRGRKRSRRGRAPCYSGMSGGLSPLAPADFSQTRSWSECEPIACCLSRTDVEEEHRRRDMYGLVSASGDAGWQGVFHGNSSRDPQLYACRRG